MLIRGAQLIVSSNEETLGFLFFTSGQAEIDLNNDSKKKFSEKSISNKYLYEICA